MCPSLYNSGTTLSRMEKQMSNKISKLLILSLLVLSALTSAAAPASATSWRSNGTSTGSAFGATAPATKFSVGTSGVVCTTTSMSGRLFGPTGALTTRVATMSLAFSGCRAAGVAATVSCGAILNLFADSGPGTVITGHVTSPTSPICIFTVPSVSGCTITIVARNGINTTIGTFLYDDSTGVLTINVSSEQLQAQWTSCGTLFGSANGTGPVPFSLNPSGDPTYTMTPGFLPNIVVVPFP
jgi:hypothetical protein